MTPQFRDATPLFDYVARRARRNVHFRKLRGTEAKPAVINGAAARLLTPGKLVKMPPKPGKPVRWRLKPVDPIELLPQPLQRRLLGCQPAPIGNLQLHRSPLDAPLWRAWVAVYMQLFELSPIWNVKGAARVELIDNAIDAELKAYIKATSVSAGSESLDPATSEDFARYTEAGNVFAAEPSRLIEQQTQLEAEAAALEYRAQIDAEEKTKLRAAVNAYARKLNRKHRHVVRLAITEPNLRNCIIAARTGAGATKVAEIRDKLTELADQILTLPPEEGAPADVAPTAGVPHDETLSQAADAGEVEGAEVDATADLSKSTLHSDALDLAAAYQAPDVDAEVSESVLHHYARSRSSGSFMRDNWSGSKRMYSDNQLITGSRYGGRWDDPAKIALRAERERMKDYSDSELKAMQETAAKFGVNLQGLLKSAAVHRATRLHQAEQAQAAAEAARKAARHLRTAACLLDKSAEEMADLRAWAAPFCEALGVSTDELLGAVISGPKPG